MKKIIKNPIFIFILSAIIFGSMGVVLAATILAKDVSYTPSNTNWKVDNVGDAIDELYNNYKNKISTLQTTNDSLNNEIETLTTKLSNATNAGVSGVFTANDDKTIHTIDIGFKPSKVFILQPNTTDGVFLIYTYDVNISNNFTACWTTNVNGTADNSECSTLNHDFSVTNTGFTFKADNISCLGKTYWYAMK